MDKELQLIEDVKSIFENRFILDLEFNKEIANALEEAKKLFLEEAIDKGLFEKPTVTEAVLTLYIIDAIVAERLSKSKYGAVIDSYFKEFKEDIIKIEHYFKYVFRDALTNEANKLLEYNISFATEHLKYIGLKSQFIKPITDSLNAHIQVNFQNSTNLIKTYKDALQKINLPTTWVTQQASDGLGFIRRNYVQQISAIANPGHYLYVGTVKGTTRNFCLSKIGKTFTKKIVEEWSKKEWDGKIPDTNAQTIFLYVGGYRCKHDLLPISERVYNYFNNLK